MKIRAVSLLLLLFLPGCRASGQIERGMALRSVLLRSQCAFDTVITADYGEEIHSFSMECTFSENGDMSFAVTQPQTIAGITGTVTEQGGKLTFSDTALAFDEMADGQVSPVTAPWVLMKTMRSGYLTSAGEEEDLLRLSIDDSYEEDALHLDIWLNDQDQPVRGEIVFDGRRILSLEVKNFRIL